MSDESSPESGRRIGEQMFGKERFVSMERSAESMHPYFRDSALRAYSMFARPGLEPRVRSLVAVAVLTVLGHTEDLRMNIFGALANGANQDEILETILQTSLYHGNPTMRAALLVARDCFKNYRPTAPDAGQK